MQKVLSFKISGLFQNYWYFSKFTVAIRTGIIVIVPVRCLSLRTLGTIHANQGIYPFFAYPVFFKIV